jgi:hypothetical protein
VDWIQLPQDRVLVAVSYEHDNGIYDFLKCGEFI